MQNWRSQLNITTANMYTTGGGTDEVWKWLFMLVETLGRDGASSDESEPEDESAVSGMKVCRVKIRRWRAKWLDRFLTMIDLDRNVQNAYGNYRSGNRPRRRVRPGVKISADRWVPPGLPINFYDADWYSSLTLSEKKMLAAVEPIEILNIEQDIYT